MTEVTAPVIPQQRPLQPAVSVALRPRLEPTCAVFFGALAAGGLALEGGVIVRLLSGWLLADIILGFALAQLLATVRVAVRVGPAPAAPHRQRPCIPYAEPGSPGERLSRALARRLEHWQEQLQPAVGHHVASFVTAAATALLIAAYLGTSALALSAGTLALAVVLALSAASRVDLLARWYAGMAIAIAWCLGHCLYAAISPASWGMATLLGLAAFGRMAVATEDGRAARRGRHLVSVVWSVLVFAMLAARQPIAAGITAIAGLAESMSLREAALRPGRVGRLVAMWLAASIIGQTA